MWAALIVSQRWTWSAVAESIIDTCAVHDDINPALLCSSRTVTVTVWVCPPSVLEIQTAPICWMRRTVGSQRAPWSLHRGMAPWGPAGAPDAARSAAHWTAPLQAPALGDPHPCFLVRATFARVTVLSKSYYEACAESCHSRFSIHSLSYLPCT